VHRVYTTTRRRPNSALRKVAQLRPPTATSGDSYIPCEGHNLREHSLVMIRGGPSSTCPRALHIIRSRHPRYPVSRTARNAVRITAPSVLSKEGEEHMSRRRAAENAKSSGRKFGDLSSTIS